MLPDEFLVDQVKRGDVQAYGVLVDRYERAVFAAVLRRVGNRHAAEDASQEVFAQGYFRLAGLRDGARFGPWLMRIAYREGIRAAKALRRARATSIEEAPGPAPPGHNGQLLDDEKQRLLARVHDLPAHERLTIALRYFGGHSVQEIADMTGRSVGTVTKRLSRALARLRKSF